MPHSLVTYSISLISIFGCFGCASPINDSRLSIEHDVDFSSYRYVVIYKADTPSFIEQDLAQLLSDRGLSVIGINEVATKPQGSVLGFRYESYFVPGLCRVTLQANDLDTGRTILTVMGRGATTSIWGTRRADCGVAWSRVTDELLYAFP